MSDQTPELTLAANQAHQEYNDFGNDLINISEHEQRLLELENINGLTRDELLELVHVTRSRMIRDQILMNEDEDYRPYECPDHYDSCAVTTYYKLHQKVVTSELVAANAHKKRQC